MILVVCAGNVCRSPLAERWLLNALRRNGIEDVGVASAGVRALVGRPMDPDTVRVGETMGLDCEGHQARQLDASLLREARLVLTASLAQRRGVVELFPPAVQRTFGLRQLGRLLAAGDPRALAALEPGDDPVDALRRFAVTQRGPSTGARADDDDVTDPHGRAIEVHRRAMEQMLPALHQVATTLHHLRYGPEKTPDL